MSDLSWSILIFCAYFLPTLIAGFRGHKNGTPILLVNLLFGWTGIGWIWALLWSTTSHTRKLANDR